MVTIPAACLVHAIVCLGFGNIGPFRGITCRRMADGGLQFQGGQVDQLQRDVFGGGSFGGGLGRGLSSSMLGLDAAALSSAGQMQRGLGFGLPSPLLSPQALQPAALQVRRFMGGGTQRIMNLTLHAF